MRESFFPLTVLATGKRDLPTHPECGACGLSTSCRRPKLPVSGRGRKKILIITDRVGLDEEVNGVHLSGGFGRQVGELLRTSGVDLREDCWATAASICSYAGRKPPKDLIHHCRPNLTATLAALKPEVIIPLGEDAVKALVGGLWRESVGSEDRWAGYRMPHAGLNAWICPTFHPRRVHVEKTPVAGILLAEHLREACKLKGRPHARVPDYQSRVECVADPRDAAHRLEELRRDRGVLAFDYETTTLKPDGPHARIVCCSFSDGLTSIAFPWLGGVVDVVRDILADPRVGKVASNAKFEDRWTKIHLGVEVKNWHWDTMLAAHGLENNTKEKSIASIKFQAFAHLGVDTWDDKVAPYLKAKGGNDKLGNAPNQIHKVDLPSLLRYNALDSLYEFLVYERQLAVLKSYTTSKEVNSNGR